LKNDLTLNILRGIEKVKSAWPWRQNL